MATREFTPLRTPRPLRTGPLSNWKRVVTQLDFSLIHPRFTALKNSRTDRGADGESRSRLVDLRARGEEGDDEERHYSGQNVDSAAHHDPANSSSRCPFRR
jgi:hypothetical protein